MNYLKTPLQHELTDLHNRLHATWFCSELKWKRPLLFHSVSVLLWTQNLLNFLTTVQECSLAFYSTLCTDVFVRFAFKAMELTLKATEWAAWTFPDKACSYAGADRLIFRIWANFRPPEKALLVGISVWNFVGYLSVYMQKAMSGWPVFHSNFCHWKLEFSCFESTAKQGKNYWNICKW